MAKDISALNDIYRALTTARAIANDALSLSYRGRPDDTDRARGDLAVIERGLKAYSNLDRS